MDVLSIPISLYSGLVTHDRDPINCVILEILVVKPLT